MMKMLYEFYWDCGRMGEIHGMFIADEKDVEKIKGEEIYLGEVLGKHSEIFGTIDDGDIVVRSSDQHLIEQLLVIWPGGNISGFNPVDIYNERC